MNEELIALEATVEWIKYQNEENGYTVCEVSDAEENEIIVVGELPYLSIGESVTLYGKWTHHAVYGRQFKAEYYEKNLLVNENDILRYLSSGTIKGIGPKTARKIVDMYGTDTFDVLENHFEWLTQIGGISPKKAKAIHEDFCEKAGARETLLFCREFLSPATSMRIYKKWGRGSVERIKQDPYRLCGEFNGIGFRHADQIAMSLGVKNDADIRIESGIRYALGVFAQRDGHTYVTEDKLIEAVSALLEVPSEKVAAVLSGSVAKVRMVPYGEERHVYLKSYYEAEEYIARKLIVIDRMSPAIDRGDAEQIIDQIEEMDNIRYAPLQRKAIHEALLHGVMVLTGGPGTGKTTVIKALIRIFDHMGFDYALTAPTGRAAKRISESTSHEAKTIHRLLEMEYNDEAESRFARCESNLLEENVIIVDEASMVDTLLMESLLRAIKPGSRLIVIGDACQLPSVSAGNVLEDVIASERFSVVRLTEIFRQAQESGIVMNAHAINRGEHPDLSIKHKDFFFISKENERDIPAYLCSLYRDRLPKTYGADTVNRIQVICPSKKGEAGTEHLNLVLQSYLNPPSPMKNERKSRDRIFREGDRVMQIRNNYTMEWESDRGETGTGVYNGDIGTISEIDNVEEYVAVSFDGKHALYDFSELEELEHAYAITVHKSQGSEYPFLIIPLGRNCPPMLMTRNLIYTAITRGEQMVIVLGSKEVFFRMVENDRHVCRNTGLIHFLRNGEEV
ncbi:MAG: ATP-dependent RecD-like DNA helicase [Clostridia bacterium]|nr:ATP-dependent RecD-like DNA helicase [Clostridia bacterium]